MKKKHLKLLACIASSHLLASIVLAQTFGNQAHRVTFEPRYTDRLCPPEYPETRAMMREFMQKPELITRFQTVFPESSPRSFSDISLLTDKEDAEACSHFSHQWESAINRKAQLFEDGESHYVRDITFYKGGGFYFVVAGGGTLMEKDPDGSGEERWYGWGNNGVYVYDGLTDMSVDWECLWEALQPAGPPSNCFQR